MLAWTGFVWKRCYVFVSMFCLYRNYMNDSLRTNVFVRFQAETIACACIFLAARALQVTRSVGLVFTPNVFTSARASAVEFKCFNLVLHRSPFHPDPIGTCCLEPVKTRSKRFASPHLDCTPGKRSGFFFFFSSELNQKGRTLLFVFS